MEVVFFNSFGNGRSYFQRPIANYVFHFLQVVFYPLPLQSYMTTVCGQFCGIYIYSRCKGKSLKEFFSEFVSENICNDHRGYNFVAQRYRTQANF